VAAAVADFTTRTEGPIAESWDQGIRTRLQAGEERALAEVFDQLSSFVFGLARRVIGDPRAAEDVTQDVFLHLWEHPEAFEPARGSLRTWLGTLAHRRAVDHVRREESRRRRTERDAGRRPPAIVTAERVRAALDALPEEQRRCIQLAYFGGKTYREVAEALGIPEGTAKSRLRLGLRRVAEVLEAEGLDPWT
jgi:RNA polymerase sigma factor (sigma-70 family)